MGTNIIESNKKVNEKNLSVALRKSKEKHDKIINIIRNK